MGGRLAVSLKRTFTNLPTLAQYLLYGVVGVLLGVAVSFPTKITVGIPAFCFFFLLIHLLTPMFGKTNSQKSLYKKLALSGFVLRAMAAFALVSVSLYLLHDKVGGYSFANDSYRYLYAAHRLNNFFESGGNLWYLLSDRFHWFEIVVISNYFPLIAWGITNIFGGYETLLPGSLYSAFMGGLSVVMITKLAEQVFPDSKKRKINEVSLLSIMFPSFILFTSIFQKEATVIFLCYSALYLLYKLIKERHYSLLPLLFLNLFALTAMRVYLSVVVLFAAFLAYFMVSVDVSKPLKTTVLIFKTLVGLIIAYFLSKHFLRLDFILNVLSLENIDYIRMKNFGHGATYFSVGDLTTPMGILKAIPVGLTYMVMAPFPWQWFSGGDVVENLLGADMILYYLLLPYTAVGVYRTIKEKNLAGMILITFFFSLAIPYGLLIGNFGSIFRLRIQLLPCIFIMAIYGGSPMVRHGYLVVKHFYERITKRPVEKDFIDLGSPTSSHKW